MKVISTLSVWLYRRLANRYALIIAAAVFLCFLIVVLPAMAGRLSTLTGIDISPDTSFIYSSEDLYLMAEAYGPQGRAYYVYSRFTFDLIWPIAYLFFLATAISYLLKDKHPDNCLRLLNLAPFAAVLFDFLENSAASIVMHRYPMQTPLAAELAPLFTFSKWIFIGLSFLVLAAGITYHLHTKIKG